MTTRIPQAEARPMKDPLDPVVDDRNDYSQEQEWLLGISGPLNADEIRAKYKDDPNWPIQSFDAVDWAKGFIAAVAKNNITIDEAFMVTWFASAMMRGWDEHANRPTEQEARPT